jgi:hypothetical protein
MRQQAILFRHTLRRTEDQAGARLQDLRNAPEVLVAFCRGKEVGLHLGRHRRDRTPAKLTDDGNPHRHIRRCHQHRSTHNSIRTQEARVAGTAQRALALASGFQLKAILLHKR